MKEIIGRGQSQDAGVGELSLSLPLISHNYTQ